MLATPTTLIAMLKTVAYAWTQEALADNAREVHELGRELYDRLGTVGGHLDRLGRSIGAVVGSYNKAVELARDARASSARARCATCRASTTTCPRPEPVTELPAR